MKKIFAILILSVFLLSFASAFSLNSKHSIDTNELDYDLHGKNIKYNKLWEKYKPIEIKNWLGKTKLQIALTEHTNICGNDNTCLSKMEIYLADDGVLIDDNKFYTLQDNGEWIEQDIRWSKFQYWGDVADYETQCTKEKKIELDNRTNQEVCKEVKTGTHKGWINYNLGDEVNAGNYIVQLSGEKKPSRTVDWRIETQGRIIEELAVWGAKPIVYQEFQDSYTISGYVDDSSFMRDGNWGTYGRVDGEYGKSRSFYYDEYYTIPEDVDSVILRIKTSYTSDRNISIPDNNFSGEIHLYIQGYRSYGNGYDNRAINTYYINSTGNQVLIDSDTTSYYLYETGIYWMTSDAAQVTLNSPADNYTSTTNNIQFNATAEVTGGATLTNMSLWTNESGSWSKYNLTTFEQFENNTENHGGSMTFNGGQSFPTGIKFTTKEAINLISATMSSGTSGTRVRLMASNGITTLQTGSLSEKVATFSYSLSAGTDYYIFVDSSGAQSNFQRTTTSPFPKEDDYINWTHGWHGSADSNLAYAIQSIVLSVPTNIFSSTRTFNRTITDNIIWNVKACDSDGDCGFAPSNYSLFLDTQAPSIDLLSPNETFNYLKEGSTLNLTGYINDTNLDACWYEYNNTNNTFSCTTETLFNEAFNQSTNEKTSLTVYANDSVGNENSKEVSWGYKVFENSRTLNSSSYETKSETFKIDVSNGANLTVVTLDYNGTEYSTTKEGTVYSKTLDIPLGVQDRSVRWKFTYAGDTFYSSYSYQNISEAVWTICNASYTDDFLNISFRDESTLTNVAGTIQTSTFIYYLGSGDVTKTYTYTDSGNATNYKFCTTPNQTFNVDSYVNYLGDGYPNRIWEPESQTYNSNVTEKTLYLLAATDGIYVTFVTATSFNTAISGVDISISRTISGETTTVSNGITDSAGSFTAWLNPNYDHEITASKTGYTTNTQTIRPTQTSYTLVMSTGADEYTYVSDYEGLKWFVFPGVGVRNSTVSTDFGFNITAKNGNLVNCKIELLNQDKTLVLASAISPSANGSSCEVLVAHSMSSDYARMKGRLLIDVGNGYQLLEDDAYWAYLSFNSTGMTFNDWFKGLKTSDLSYFNNDDQHREYTYILLFFLFVMIVCSVLNVAGWDIQNPGGMIFLVGTIVWIASIPGFLTLNYISPYVWIDQYFVAGVYSLFMIGYATRNLT